MLILTFDVGTTSTKGSLFNETLQVVASCEQEYTVLTPENDYVEMDPCVYWDTFKWITGNLLTHVDAEEISVVSITTQGETFIPVDRAGKPLYNAIVWLDSRAKNEAFDISQKFDDDRFYRTFGMPNVSAAMPVAKLLWFMRNCRDLYEKTYKFLLLEDYLIYKLTGLFVSEESLLSSTGYFDINENRYSREMLEICNIDEDKLPMIVKSSTSVGNISSHVAKETGLSPKTTVATSAMDQISSAVGIGNILPGRISETTGTALVVSATVQLPNYDNAMKVPYYRHYHDGYICMPYSSTAGILVKWFKDNFLDSLVAEGKKQNRSPYDLMDKLAENVPAGSNGLITLPHFAGRCSPRFDPDATGVFYGVGLQSRREHFIRSIYEGVGFVLRENLEFLEMNGIKSDVLYSVGGGSQSALWTQIKSDICRKEIVVPEIYQTTSVGAAILGGVSAGIFSDVAQACSCLKYASEFHPNEKNAMIYDDLFDTYLKLNQKLFD